MRNKNQKDAVLNYIEKRGSIISREASRELGVDRLAARISEIKDILKDPEEAEAYGWGKYAGRHIATSYEYVTNRYGQKTRIARYSLDVEDRPEA